MKCGGGRGETVRGRILERLGENVPEGLVSKLTQHPTSCAKYLWYAPTWVINHFELNFVG